MVTFHRLLGLIVLLQCTRSFVGETTSQTTRTALEYLKAKRRESLRFEYNPNHGYEPYWADSELVLSNSSTNIPKVCGVACKHFLRRIKHVCARQTGDERDPNEGCGINYSWKCSGKPGLDYNHGYKTFGTYCQFLNAQCQSKPPTNRWILVNVGKCKVLDDYFKPLWSGNDPVNRMKLYLSILGTEPPQSTTRK